jgi:hypothetical protein
MKFELTESIPNSYTTWLTDHSELEHFMYNATYANNKSQDNNRLRFLSFLIIYDLILITKIILQRNAYTEQ